MLLCVVISLFLGSTDFELNVQLILVLQALVSLKRLGKFLCQDEIKPENVARESFKSGERPLVDKLYCAIRLKTVRMLYVPCETFPLLFTSACQ